MGRLLCACVLLSLVVVMHAQLPQASATPQGCAAPYSQAITRITQDWKDGYNSGNADQVAALYDQDAYYLTQHFATGIVHGRPNIRAYVQRGVDAHYRIDSIQMIALHCSGGFAYAVTRYQSTNAGQRPFGVNLVVLKETHGKWLIVAHEAAVPDPATALRQLEPKPE